MSMSDVRVVHNVVPHYCGATNRWDYAATTTVYWPDGRTTQYCWAGLFDEIEAALTYAEQRFLEEPPWE